MNLRNWLPQDLMENSLARFRSRKIRHVSVRTAAAFLLASAFAAWRAEGTH